MGGGGGGGPLVISTDCPRPAWKTLRTVDDPLLYVITKASHLHMFLSLANLNIQKVLKHSSTRQNNSTENLHVGLQRFVNVIDYIDYSIISISI